MKDFDMELDPLKSSANPYFKKVLFDKRERIRKYSKYHIPVGIQRNGRPFYINTKEAFRMLMIAATRSGKTFILRGMADRIIRAKQAVVFLPDVKDEFKSSNYPLQSKFHNLLLPGEKPSPTTVMTFRPTFFKNVRGYEELPKDNYWYTPNLADLSELDFMTLIKAEELTEPQKIAVKEIYERLKKYVNVEVDLEDIYSIIDELEDFDDRQKMSLRTKFLPLKYSNFFSEERKGLPFARMLKARIALALNMEGFDNISREGSGLPQVFVSIWLRKIINLRRKKKIPPLFIITDEATRFIPANSNPSCKVEFLESIDLDSRYNINYFFAAQAAQKLPDTLINQCRYIWIPYNADIETFKYLFKLSGVVSWALNIYAQRCAQIKKQMKKYEWVLIDRNMNNYTIIKSIAPLSKHAETTI